MQNLRFLVHLVFATLLLQVPGGVSGQGYPAKPIRIVTYAPGGIVDFASRVIATPLSQPASLGQPVIVDNRSGGVIPGEVVSRAAPDGYTLLVTGFSFYLGPLFGEVPYDPIKDFSPITLLSSSPTILVVNSSVPVDSVRALIDLAKSKPNELNFGSSGIGSAPHMAGELLKSLSGARITHIPYKSGAQAVTAVLGGQIQIGFLAASSVAPYIKSNRLKALGVTSARPSILTPGVPTIAETLPGYEALGTSALFAPAKTPAAIINRIHQEVVKVLDMPDVKSQFLKAGEEVAGSSPEQLAAEVRSNIEKMARIIKNAGGKLE